MPTFPTGTQSEYLASVNNLRFSFQVSWPPETKNEEEVRKVITAVLAEGRLWVLFDNLTGKLRSPALASVLTTKKWSDRNLGETRMLSLENRSIWSATANNLEVDGDIARRVVWVRLDARVECPDSRMPDSFRHPNILQWAKENRASIVGAILTLVRAWCVRAMPLGNRSMGSFESWARAIGGILDVAGIDGFLTNAEKHRHVRDEETADLRRFFEVWWNKHEDDDIGVKQLIEIAQAEELFPYVMAAETPLAQRHRLGHILKKNEGRQFGVYRLCSANRDNSARRQYCLEKTLPSAIEGSNTTQPRSAFPRYGEDGYPSPEQQRFLSELLSGSKPDGFASGVDRPEGTVREYVKVAASGITTGMLCVLAITSPKQMFLLDS